MSCRAPVMTLLASAVAPAEAVSGERLLVNLVVILATAAAVAAGFRRLRLEAIPGYLVAGAIVGYFLRYICNALALLSSADQ